MLSWDFAPARGVWHCRVPRDGQAGGDLLSVLLPAPYDPTARYPVVYLLPCEAGEACVFGHPLEVLRQLEAPHRYRCLFAMPTFATIPWYGYHASDPAIRHDARFIETIIPLVEQCFSTPGAPAGRCLLGFSKSGWGAFSLIARYPDILGAAASWDAPLLMDLPEFGRYQTRDHFGTAAHFARFRPPALFAVRPEPFRTRTRLVLAGHDLFGREALPAHAGSCHTAGMHALFTQLGIRHHYRNDLTTPHAWHATWLAPLLELLLKVDPVFNQ